MIHSGFKDIYLIYKLTKVIQSVYKGLQLVWTGILSCFSYGRWFGKKPWLGQTKWRSKPK